MMLDIALANGWLSLLLSVVAVAGVIKGYLSSGTKENAIAIGRLRDSCEGLSKRMQKVENDLTHLPSAKEFNELALAVSDIRGDMKSISKSVEATERSSRRMEDWLIKKGAE